jgi:hypothetical protein
MLKGAWGNQYLQFWTSLDIWGQNQVPHDNHTEEGPNSHRKPKELSFHFKAPPLTGPVWHKCKPLRDTKIREKSNLALKNTCYEAERALTKKLADELILDSFPSH